MESNQFNQEQEAESPHEARMHRSHMPDIAKPLDPKPVAPSLPPVAPEPPKPLKKSPLKTILLVSAVVLAVAAIGFGVAYSLSKSSDGTNVAVDENKSINANAYQALFLTNGQVYFGHLSGLNNKYVTITDIYYLQVQQNLQQGSGGNTNSQVSLAKLGSELHGPEDTMHVASDQVLFWENLKSDSKVTQAINAYKKQ